MSTFRTVAGRAVRWALDRAGYDLVRREVRPFGQDAFSDVARIAGAWGRPVRTVFDVGANVGQTTRRALRAFPEAKAYAFEPHPRTFATLQAVVASDPRALAFQTGLGAEEGEAELFEYDADVLNSMAPDAPYAVRYGQPARRLTLACTTLDRFCEDHGVAGIDLLKIDTEGFDLMVLKGGGRMLAEGRIGFVYAEFNHIGERAGVTGGSLAALDGVLAPAGFRFVASYPDWFELEGEFFMVSNALFALPPRAQ